MPLFRDEHKYPTLDKDQFVAASNAHIDKMYAQGKRVGEPFFLAVSAFISHLNIEQRNGGPFGAVIVEFEGGLDAEGKGIGKPKVVGVGANHVVPNNDPSAHAEMEAYRDAAKRKGNSDLKGAVLYTSCECCPMCLSVANGSGISKIVYVNKRAQAEAIEFSDKLQYDMFHLPRSQQMTPISMLNETKRKDILEKLGSHGAAILDDKGEVFSYGNADMRTDPTNIASINAVRNAVKKHAEAQKTQGNYTPVFCVPDGFTLVCKDIPHPAGLITADWARILRKRDVTDSDNPALDSKIPDPARIIHVTDQYEQLLVVNQYGHSTIHQDAQITYRQPTLKDGERAVHTEHFTGRVVPSAAQEVFTSWKQGTSQGSQVRY